MDEHLKIPLFQSLEAVSRQRVQDAVQLAGKALPCSVSEVVSSGIVKVRFEVNATPWTLPEVTVPIGYPEYIRYPVQVGDKGVVRPADARLGGLSGLGSGTPTLDQPANLSALTFFWLGSSNWTAALDPTALEFYSPVGPVIIRSADGMTKITVSNGGVVIDLGGPLTVNSNGHDVTVSGGGDVIADSISLKHHVHPGVQSGGDSTGQPT